MAADKTAIIVGAGLAGLTAGYRLKQAGWHVKVLESADRIGGRVGTFEKKGYFYDCCATSCSTGYREYLQLVKELGIEDKLVHGSDVVGVIRDGDLHLIDGATPVRSFLGTRFMTFGEKLRFLVGAFKLRKYAAGAVLADPGPTVKHDHYSIDELSRKCFGDSLVSTVLDPIMRVVTFGDVRETTAVELFTGLISASGESVNLSGGLQTMPTTLATHMDEIALNTEVTHVQNHDGRAEVSFRDAVGEHTESADACVITTPFPKATEICPALAKAGPGLAKQTHYAQSFVVYLGYDAPTKKNPFAIALPRTEYPRNPGIFLDHNKAPDRARSGKSLFTVYYCPEAVEEVSGWSEDKVIADACAIVEHFFPELEGHCDMTHVHHALFGSHLAPPGYFADVQEFFDNYSASEPIQVGSDYFTLPGQEGAVGGGNRAAARILQN